MADLGLPLQTQNLIPCKGFLDTNGQAEGIAEHCSCVFPLGRVTDQMGWIAGFHGLFLIFDVVRMKFLVLVKDAAQSRFLSRVNSVR